MRILFFLESLRAGGKERRFLELLNEISQNSNHKVFILLLDKDIMYSYVFKFNVEIFFIERKYLKKDPIVFFKVVQLVKRLNLDIIHSWGIMPSIYSIPSKVVFNVKLFSSLLNNCYNINEFSFINQFFFKIAYIFSDIVFSNTKYALSTYKVFDDKVKVIPNGINLSRFNIVVPVNNVFPKTSRKNILMIASANKNKNYDLYIDVAKEYFKIDNSVSFYALGNGSEYERLCNRVKTENVFNLFFLNHQPNVESYIMASDVGVLLSPNEGFPNSLMEFMGFGKPVLASNVGGIPELVVDGYSGVLVSNCIQEIVSKLKAILENDEISKSLGSNAKKTIFNEYSSEMMFNRFKNFYELNN